ncbi:MAG: nucleotide sugar dehydrogenase [Parcubacteria group bacterium]|jgi:nucleotide sugar dehydrogenase
MSEQKKQKVCVIGMGYVGLPLAAVCAKKGYEVMGFDTDTAKLAIIAQGKSPFKEEFLEKLLPQVKINVTADENEIKGYDIYLICVPTPVDAKYFPILTPVIDASRTVAAHMKKGALVVLESTVNPGVSAEVVRPIFEKAGFEVGKDVFIAHCPERVNPGDSKWNVGNLPRVVGSFDEKGLKIAKDFYESVVDGEIMAMDSIEEAEAVKILENSFRDVNIAFVNEAAKSFSHLNIDITNVIRGASTKPYSFMAHWPSCGVGGHCIPVDPYYMIEKAKEHNFDHKFLRTARTINNSMPEYTVDLLQHRLNQVEKSVKGTKIGIMGLSYKANVSDLRESPALKIIEKLRKLGADLIIFDPFVPGLSNVKSIDELLEKSDALLLTANHAEFVQIPVENFAKNNIKIIIDGKNCLDKKAIQTAGIVYSGIGR